MVLIGGILYDQRSESGDCPAYCPCRIRAEQAAGDWQGARQGHPRVQDECYRGRYEAGTAAGECDGTAERAAAQDGRNGKKVSRVELHGRRKTI